MSATVSACGGRDSHAALTQSLRALAEMHGQRLDKAEPHDFRLMRFEKSIQFRNSKFDGAGTDAEGPAAGSPGSAKSTVGTSRAFGKVPAGGVACDLEQLRAKQASVAAATPA